MKHLLRVFALLALATPGWALGPGDRVDNFRLLDHTGESHELYYLSDAEAVVLMVHGNGCQAVRDALPRLEEIRAAYDGRGVEFLLINAGDDRAAINEDAQRIGIDLPILMDRTGIIAESLGLTETSEVLVIDTARWQLAYRGTLARGSEHYVADALDAVLTGEEARVSRTEVAGCAVDLPHPGAQQISYADTIAPLLIDNCITCHRPKGIGPWAMTSYTMVRGFAPMIREVIRTQRMPPWHADPRYGDFANDRSLSADEIRTLVHWIEAGAPRGEGADPLAAYQHDWPEWALGPPDLVIDVPAFEIPATGVVEYQYRRVRNPLDRDVWVRATEILPGDRSALHHVITSFALPDANGKISRDSPTGSLGGYVPGTTGSVFPADTGVLLPAGAVFSLQMHYTTYGKASTDRSRLGLYFHDAPPKYALDAEVLMNTEILIPPNTKAYSDSASKVFERDVLVYSLLPHAHYRGRASEFRAIYPDGTKELLLSVPNYDFNWQTTYMLETPKRLPAGTKVVHTTTWDNSAQNPANPDPNRAVPWGLQSWDEMLFGAIRFRYLEPEDGDTPASVARVE